MKLGPPACRRANRSERGGDDAIEWEPGVDHRKTLRADLIAELLVDHRRRRV